jgi:hypothetical protein
VDFHVREPVPDLLIHDPDTNDHNLAVIEAKRTGAAKDDLGLPPEATAWCREGDRVWRPLNRPAPASSANAIAEWEGSGQ